MKGKNRNEEFLLNFSIQDFFSQSALLVLSLFSIVTGYLMIDPKSVENRIILRAYNENVNPSIIAFLLILVGLVYFGLVFLDPNSLKYKILITNSLLAFLVWTVFTSSFYETFHEGRFVRLLVITGYNLAISIMTTVGLFARKARKKHKETSKRKVVSKND